MTRIVDIVGRQVWDLRGRPTVEAEVVLESGARLRHRAIRGLDGQSRGAGSARRWRAARRLRRSGSPGQAIRGAISSPSSAGREVADQAAIDRAMIEADGTDDKTHFGGNAIVAVSLAVAWAAAAEARMPLWSHLRRLAGPHYRPHVPLPMIQIFGAAGTPWAASTCRISCDLPRRPEPLGGDGDDGGS